MNRFPMKRKTSTLRGSETHRLYSGQRRRFEDQVFHAFSAVHHSAPSVVQQPVSPVLIGKQAFLSEKHQPIDNQRHRGNDDQYQYNGFLMSAPLGNEDDISQSTRFAALCNEFSQHDITESQPEKQPQGIEHPRHRQWDEHFEDDLPFRSTERVSGVDISTTYISH